MSFLSNILFKHRSFGAYLHCYIVQYRVYSLLIFQGWQSNSCFLKVSLAKIKPCASLCKRIYELSKRSGRNVVRYVWWISLFLIHDMDSKAKAIQIHLILS